MQHDNLTGYIVDADKLKLKDKLERCLAVDLAIDGSADRFQVDNKHVKCKVTWAVHAMQVTLSETGKSGNQSAFVCLQFSSA